ATLLSVLLRPFFKMLKHSTNRSLFSNKTYRKHSILLIPICFDSPCCALKFHHALLILLLIYFLIISTRLLPRSATPHHTKYKLVLTKKRLSLHYFGLFTSTLCSQC